MICDAPASLPARASVEFCRHCSRRSLPIPRETRTDWLLQEAQRLEGERDGKGSAGPQRDDGDSTH